MFEEKISTWTGHNWTLALTTCLTDPYQQTRCELSVRSYSKGWLAVRLEKGEIEELGKGLSCILAELQGGTICQQVRK